MKSKCSFILKASLALVLTILMVLGSVSTVIAAVADVATGDDALPLAAKKGMDIAATGANADLASTGLTGGGYIYVSTQYAQWSNGGSAANWGDGVTFVAVFRDSNDTYSTESTHQAGTWVKNINGSNASGGQIYRFSVPSGTWSYMRLYRASAVGWNNKYNETGKIALVANTSTNNMLTYFKEGANGTTSNWEDKYQYDSTASLSALKTSATTGESVTLTPGISSNTTYNEYKSVSYSISPSSGASISGNTFTATAAGTYTVTATVTYNAKGFTGITKTADATKQITVTSASTPLAAPTNVKFSSATVTASPTGKSTLSWSAVSGAGSYKIYKGTSTTALATVTGTSYDVAAKYSNADTYYVVAVPSNTTTHSESAKSSGATLTVNKQTVDKPTITIDKTDIASGGTATITVTNSSSFDSSKYTLKLYKSSTAQSNTFTNGTTTVSAAGTYKVKAVSKDSDYYADSADSDTVTLTVSTPAWYVMGDLVASTNSWTINKTYPVNTYDSKNVFYRTITVTGGSATDKHYFRVHKGTGTASYTNSSSSSTDMSTHNTSGTAVTASVNNQTYAMYVTGNGTFVIYVDQSGTNPKVWVTQNTWAIAASAYTQTYDVATGTYKTATASTTGGTVSPASTNVEKGSSTTLKATPASGYTFDGWYKATTFTTTNRVSTDASYTFTPSANGTYYALFKQNEPAKVNISVANVDNATITAKWNNQTKTNGESLSNVPVGASVTVTVTPTSGYYVTGNTPTLSNGKFTVTASTTSISATVAKNATIKAVTNKSSRGTVSVDKTSAHQGDVIKITVTPLAGSLKTLTATYANGKTYEYKNSDWAEVQSTAGSSTNNALLGAFLSSAKDKFALAPTGAETDEVAIAALPDLAPVGAAQTINMTMQYTSAVTINATFDNYSGESTWYYNGYDTSGNALSGYHGKQMTESMVSGEKFSYYHVEGRSGTDQLMTITDGSSPSYGKVYFTNNYNWNNLHVYFYGSSISWNWPGDGMTFEYNNGSGQAVYSYQIPSGATGVIFNNGQNGVQTQDVDLTSTNGAYYLTGDGASPYATQWDSAPSDAGIAKGVEYFYQNSDHNGDYTGDFNTKGFNNHNTANKEFAKPKDLDTNSGDYYINVLYPNTTYTINGVTKKTGTNPMIIWSAKSLAGDDENVTIYAKDGSIRSESYGSTYANIADTKIYLNNETVGTKHSGNIANQTYETYKAAKGDTLVIKTQIGATDSSTLSNAADLKAKYYVRGFCVNGEVTELLEWNADGLYTLTYKVPEDDEDLKKIEITPIYYLKDTTANPIVTYRVTGFTDELKAVGTGKPNWGDTLYTYPFYGKLGSNNNALGAYPGQPMVYYKGQYQMQIPQKSTAWDIYYDDSALSGYSGNTAKANAVANTNVSGVTMSNGYYDIVHRSVMGYGDNSASADHVQTYDYGDFFKIFNEKKPVDNIVFDFKYETKKHNFENQPTATTTKSTLDTNFGTNGNGFELLTNFHGRTVDLFGTPLSGDAVDPSKTTPVYVVSIGGVNGSAGVDNIAGYYATEWMVYGSSDGSSYSRISANGKNSIPPEVLVLNDDDTTSFNTTTYPSAVTGKAVTDWKALYTALEAYRGKPVMISYEAADAQIGAGNYATSGGGGATRNDGRWLYSKNGENITSKIKIQYSDDNGDTYDDLDTTDPQVSGLSAYFTNDGVEGQMTYSTTIFPDKTFDFEAKTTNGDYKFVGWYMEDGTKITSDNASHTERSGSYTFVAKFMQVQGGQLILSHSADKGTISGTDYQGAGTAKISAVVKDGEEVIRTYDLTTSDITLDDKIIKSDSSYTIDVTLEATATGNDTYGTTTLSNPSGQTSTYFSEKSSSIDGKTKTIVLNSFTVASLFSGTTQNVKNIIYHSYFTQAVFNYTLTFNYTDRFNASKSFTRQGTLTSAQAANENYVEKSGNNFSLLPAFIQTVAPHESNFGEDITWNINKASFTQSGSTYTCTATITANQTKDTTRNVTFKLPYQHSNGIATVNGDKVGTAATTTDFALTGNNAVAFDTIPVLLNDGVNGIYTEDEKKNWIAAPATLSDSGTTKYFQYWSVKSTSAAGENDPEVARCYFQGFNFVALDNYTVTPIYDVSPTDITESGIYTGVSFLETSRNQWNDNQTRQKGETDKASDLLYNDFVLNYNFNGAEIYKNGSDVSDIQELGVVVERVQELGIKQDGSKDTDISHYTSLATDTENVIAAANAEATDGQATYKVGTKPFYKQVVDKTSLDNKNRIMFYDAFYNGAGWNMEKQTSAAKYTYKNYVYRAYTYIKYNNGGNTVVKLADAPAYFTMYDEATATYAN